MSDPAVAPTGDRPGGWTGDWVHDRLGVEVPAPVRELAGLALRRNPRRAHLIVSPVLAKHVPVAPGLALGSARDLADLVAGVLSRSGVEGAELVIGYAETATGLGHAVAAALGAPYLHSTRRPPAPGRRPIAFEESHSHASSHRLLPDDPALLAGAGALVLVDDELSTGSTAANTVRALHAGSPRGRYVVAALLDLRPAGDGPLERCAAELGVAIDVVAVRRGEVGLPSDVLERGAALVADLPAPAPWPRQPAAPAQHLAARWPAEVPHHGRHGVTADDHAALDAALGEWVDAVDAELAPGPWHVLGTEELMYLPLRLAEALAARRPGTTVSSSTRSPIAVLDHPGYAVRSAITFAASDEHDEAPRFAYNLAGVERVLVVVDDASPADALQAPDGLLGALTAAGIETAVVVVPERVAPGPLRSPRFGSYPAADVGWLLTDLSDVALEAPVAQREDAIQSGAAHYAESLPVEYVPTADYQALYAEALAASRARVARCVGVVAELVLAERGPGVVLASLARAGTPVGVLLRRWYAARHGLDVPHYTMSIVRGRGADATALRWLADHHDPTAVMFVDGWTGKGMITRELAAAIEPLNAELGTAFSPELAVLADPGRCVRLFGTRDDFLVPSACLNSTVSGLVSRTVLRDDLIGPGDFHGAKHYRELADVDVSNDFVDAVAACFDDVAAEVDAEVARLVATDRTPTWWGRTVVADVGRRFGVAEENLIKPGVGETTRVLLRRVPWKVLLDAGRGAEVPHILRLARERDVEVVEVPDLGYTTIGLIRPRSLP